ncbi:hypothetical protein JCM10212_001097 [Sporobolomyces blumeae]
MSAPRSSHPPGAGSTATRLTSDPAGGHSASSAVAPNALSQLGSFKRKKPSGPLTDAPAQPSKRARQSPPAIPPSYALSKKPDPTFPSTWPASLARPRSAAVDAPVKLKRTRSAQQEAPWTSWLRGIGRVRQEAEALAKDRKGKHKADDRPAFEDDEVLVPEKSWESPSDRSNASGNEDAGPALADYGSLDRAASSRYPLDGPSDSRLDTPYGTRALSPTFPDNKPIINFEEMDSKQPTDGRIADPLSTTRSRLFRTNPHAVVDRFETFKWHTVHLHGLLASIPDEEIWKMVTPPHLPRPVAMKVLRHRSDSYVPVFVVYGSEGDAEVGLIGLAFAYGEGQKVKASRSDKPAHTSKFTYGELADAWTDKAANPERWNALDDAGPGRRHLVPQHLLSECSTLKIDNLPRICTRQEVVDFVGVNPVIGVGVTPPSRAGDPPRPPAYLLCPDPASLRRVKSSIAGQKFPGMFRQIWYSEEDKPTPWRWDEMDEDWAKRHGGPVKISKGDGVDSLPATRAARPALPSQASALREARPNAARSGSSALEVAADGDQPRKLSQAELALALLAELRSSSLQPPDGPSVHPSRLASFADAPATLNQPDAVSTDRQPSPAVSLVSYDPSRDPRKRREPL